MNSKLPSILKEARIRKGLGVDKLARRAGVGRDIIYRIESGETPDPRISTVIALADALELTVDELLGHTHLPKTLKESELAHALFEMVDQLEAYRPKRLKRR